MVELHEVRGVLDLRRFVLFPFSIYSDSPYWVPPLVADDLRTLDPKRNPAFEYCDAKYWLAYRDGEPAGRIAAIINRRYIERWHNKYARFGWIDFVDDREVSASLLGAAERWAAERGMAALVGPMGFTDLDPEGMLVEGFEELGTLPMIYNYPYYPRHLEALGYRKEIDWLEYEVNVPDRTPERVRRIAELCRKRYKLRTVDAKRRKDVLPYAPGIFQVVNQAYAPLYGVVELTEEQIQGYVKQYFGFIRAELVIIVLDQHDDVVAFAVAMPSLSRALQAANGRIFPLGFVHLLKALRSPDSIDFYLGAVRPDYQGKGLTSIIMQDMQERCNRLGITSAESSGNLESNHQIKALWTYYEHRQHKRRRAYIKQL
jgi:GNAT superfamily N-acetyltransferase